LNVYVSRDSRALAKNYRYLSVRGNARPGFGELTGDALDAKNLFWGWRYWSGGRHGNIRGNAPRRRRDWSLNWKCFGCRQSRNNGRLSNRIEEEPSEIRVKVVLREDYLLIGLSNKCRGLILIPSVSDPEQDHTDAHVLGGHDTLTEVFIPGKQIGSRHCSFSRKGHEIPDDEGIHAFLFAAGEPA
jgi:hypothetical protein